MQIKSTKKSHIRRFWWFWFLILKIIAAILLFFVFKSADAWIRDKIDNLADNAGISSDPNIAL